MDRPKFSPPHRAAHLAIQKVVLTVLNNLAKETMNLLESLRLEESEPSSFTTNFLVVY